MSVSDDNADNAGRAIRPRAATVILVLIAIAYVGLIGRLVQINTTLAPKLRGIAERQQQASMRIPARRGNIYDRRGRLLATSLMRPSVFADPAMIDQPAETARKLAAILEIDPGRIEERIRNSGAPRFCWIERQVTAEQADAVRRSGLSGVSLQQEFVRSYPLNQVAAQVLGFVSRDGRGLGGVELAADELLSGQDGRRVTVCDARRSGLQPEFIPSRAPVDGGHVVLTIDSVIQSIAESQLREQVAAFEAESGMAVVMSPRTGDVLAMACEPSFDPNEPTRYPASRRRNRCITDPVEPGSIFKPFIVAGALEGGYCNTTERIDCHNGLYRFGTRLMHDTSPKGELTVSEILIYSSNIGMGILGTRMGNEALHEVVTRLGFGERTGIELPGESAGPLAPLRGWTDYSTTSVTMGQEIAVTPLQLARAFCALVNGGRLPACQVIAARLASDGQVTGLDTPARPLPVVIEPEIADFIAFDALRKVVTRGGHPVNASPYQMCGKSGTAEVAYEDRRGYEPDVYLSSYMGAAPLDDPAVVVLVMLKRPNADIHHYGRIVAGPAVRDIVRGVLDYWGHDQAAHLSASQSIDGSMASGR